MELGRPWGRHGSLGVHRSFHDQHISHQSHVQSAYNGRKHLTKRLLALLTMAHDAEFVENRLRLDVFLRAVGHGMPQRPSRFQRCDQFSNEQPQSYPSRLFSGAHTSTTIVPVAACQTVPLPCKYRASDVACSAAAAANLNEANVSNERVAFGAYDLAREKVQLSPCLQRPSVKKPVSGSETTTPMPFRSRKILRRRLPVHTLPLVRVPTNGLPEPCVRKWGSIMKQFMLIIDDFSTHAKQLSMSQQ